MVKKTLENQWNYE